MPKESPVHGFDRPRLLNGRYALSPNPRTGGMARVFKANDLLRSNAQVAVKIFNQERIERTILDEVFNRETSALKELQHPGIVEMLDAGIDDDSGQPFVVLEWMETNLTDQVRSSPPAGWDDFAAAVALPILEALAFAHSRTVVHRDLKPENILIDQHGKPKLADFGVSKLKSRFKPGITVADFVSRPYCPKEFDDGTFTYTRDVFAFSVVLLACLTKVELDDYDSIDTAFAQFDAPPEVRNLVEKSLSSDPSERPANANVLLAELRAIQVIRTEKFRPKRKCFLQLSMTTTNRLTSEMALSVEKVREFVAQDLASEPGIRPYTFRDVPEQDKAPDGHYEISGMSLRYHVKVNEPRPDSLFICNVWRAPNSVLEKNRERSWRAPYNFCLGTPYDIAEAEDVIRDLQLGVVEHQAELKQKEIAEQDNRLYRLWGEILHAKEDVERSRQAPLKYRGIRVDRNRAFFELASHPEEELVGQPRTVRLSNGRYLGGEVDQVHDSTLVLYVPDGDPSLFPRSGDLVFDTHAAEINIDRQKRSLDAIRFERAVRPDVGRLIVHPENARIPHCELETQFFHSDLDEDKKEAIRAALGTQDFLVVDGPPGTGKTTFIAELVCQTIYHHPDARILLTSQTHVALDNALERIQKLDKDLRLVRVGRTRIDDQETSPQVAALFLENQMGVWRDKVLDRGRQFLTQYASDHGISQTEVDTATLCEETASRLEEIKHLKIRIDCREKELEDLVGKSALPAEFRSKPKAKEQSTEEVRQLREELSKLQKQLTGLEKTLRQSESRLIDLEVLTSGELDSRSSEEMLVLAGLFVDPKNDAAVKYQRLRKIHLEWEGRFGRSEDFHSAFLKRSQVIAGTCVGMLGVRGIQDLRFDLCVVDEASKATATEALVPISRSRKWVLVGDQRQLPPFADEALRSQEILAKYEFQRSDLTHTLFDRLVTGLPDPCRIPLITQRRMVPAIGNLISECFYGGKLKSAEKARDPIIGEVLCRPVTWMSTTNLANRQELVKDCSCLNRCEAMIIRGIINDLNSVSIGAGKRYEVAVLTGYGAQRNELRRAFSQEVSRWTSLDLEVNTVDAFQGREADIAIYSITRSNPDQVIGFLREEKRLNVALSRARFGLAIVGDHIFCATAVGENPFRSVLDHIERNPKDCSIVELQP